jgi:hypothetical protein
MKLAIAFFSIVLTLGLGACSSYKTGVKEVSLTSCTPGDPGKPVMLQENSWAPDGRVVRITQ